MSKRILHVEQILVSPKGGKSPLEPRSLDWPNLDTTAKAWQNDPQRMALLNHTKSPDQINGKDYDGIFFTGGHAVMFDFLNDEQSAKATAQRVSTLR